jgi:abnormal spindle-like microcephaly-associated protein
MSSQYAEAKLSDDLISSLDPPLELNPLFIDAIRVLLLNQEPEAISQPMAKVEESTRFSTGHCAIVAKDSVLMDHLIQLLFRCHRTKPHESTLRSLLGILSNLCRYDELLPAVFHAKESIVVMTEKLQMFRESEVRD